MRSARDTLWYITFIGFAVSYMFRVTLNMAIVDMVQTKPATNNLIKTNECLVNEQQSATIGLSDYQMLNVTNIKITANNDSTIIILNKIINNNNSLLSHQFEGEEKRFKWNEHQQSLLLGSFYWLHWLTQIPGGILAKRYGTKLVFGLSNVISCSLCFIMPMASNWDYRALICVRVFQGFISGLTLPAMHDMIAQWIPPNERSKFVTSYLGSSIGIAFSFPFFGYIILWSSWEWVYHISGIIGIIWYLTWHFFVFDSPAVHPRINPSEREFIEKSLGTTIQKSKVNTPWKYILTDRTVWIIVFAQFGHIWGLFTYVTQSPTYFKYIHGWGIQMIGILSGLPHVIRMLFAYCFSLFADYLITTNKMSRTNVRKLAGFVCLIINGFLLIGVAYSGCYAITAVIFLTLATSTQGASSTGPLANIVDISPNYASIIMGLSGMISLVPGFISPVVVGILTFGNHTVTQWKYVFLISAALLIITGLLYVLFGDAELKHWNNPIDKQSKSINDDIYEPILLNQTNLTIKSSILNNDKDFNELKPIIIEESEDETNILNYKKNNENTFNNLQ